jgi:DNA-binding CsgD family transcriptional regulator
MHSADMNTFEIFGSTLRATPAGLLTKCQCEVVLWAAEGKTNEEIAIINDISPRAVKARLVACYCRLKANSKAQLVAKAFVSGVLHGLPTLLLAIILYGPGGSNHIDKMRNARRFTGRRSREERYELFTEVSEHSTHPKPKLEFV